MTAAPQPTEQSLTQDLLREILAIANDPGAVPTPDDPSPAAFRPRDGVESMLAHLAVVHVRRRACSAPAPRRNRRR